MVNTIKFIVPAMLEDVLDKCIAKYDLAWNDLVIINNHPTDKIADKYKARGANVINCPENIGVGRSWNYGLKLGADMTFLISSSMVFNNGFSELVDKLKYANEYGLLTNHGWHCIGLGKRTIKEVGLIDTNFYPGYFEDNDYSYRLKLAKIHKSGEFCMPKVELNAECQGTALTIKSGIIKPVRFDLLEKYYIKKWGGSPEAEKYDKPFGKYLIGWFPEHTTEQLKIKYS